MRQKGQNLNLANSNQQWAKDARNAYAHSRMAQASRNIRSGRSSDNILEYANALQDIGAAGGNSYIASGPGAGNDFLMSGRQARDMYRKQLREEEVEEMELEAGRLKLAQAREELMERRKARGK